MWKRTFLELISKIYRSNVTICPPVLQSMDQTVNTIIAVQKEWAAFCLVDRSARFGPIDWSAYLNTTKLNLLQNSERPESVQIHTYCAYLG